MIVEQKSYNFSLNLEKDDFADEKKLRNIFPLYSTIKNCMFIYLDSTYFLIPNFYLLKKKKDKWEQKIVVNDISADCIKGL